MNENSTGSLSLRRAQEHSQGEGQEPRHLLLCMLKPQGRKCGRKEAPPLVWGIHCTHWHSSHMLNLKLFMKVLEMSLKFGGGHLNAMEKLF